MSNTLVISKLKVISVMEKIKSHRDLRVYKLAFETAQKIFQLTLGFPPVERYSLTDQIRRSSRSVAANIAEPFRMRRYPAAFISKLNQSEGEAAESQVWLEFADACNYIQPQQREDLYFKYEQIISMLVSMINMPEKWRIG
jgi:four helix bundle protein